MYFIATCGPIEVGRVTVLKQPKPYLASVNAVAVKNYNVPQVDDIESKFNVAFEDFEEAKAYAISFWPSNYSILWIKHEYPY
jgi:hypothetical protein